jgi:hypothetical protein
MGERVSWPYFLFFLAVLLVHSSLRPADVVWLFVDGRGSFPAMSSRRLRFVEERWLASMHRGSVACLVEGCFWPNLWSRRAFVLCTYVTYTPIRVFMEGWMSVYGFCNWDASCSPPWSSIYLYRSLSVSPLCRDGRPQNLFRS